MEKGTGSMLPKADLCPVVSLHQQGRQSHFRSESIMADAQSRVTGIVFVGDGIPQS